MFMQVQVVPTKAGTVIVHALLGVEQMNPRFSVCPACPLQWQSNPPGPGAGIEHHCDGVWQMVSALAGAKGRSDNNSTVRPKNFMCYSLFVVAKAAQQAACCLSSTAQERSQLPFVRSIEGGWLSPHRQNVVWMSTGVLL